MDDVCALSMVHRIAAMLDLDTGKYAEGDALPHGWHVGLFGIHTRDSELRPDGVAGFGVQLPDVGLPRVVMGGRRTQFLGEIPIGAPVTRFTRVESVTPKEGRTGRIAIASVVHHIFASDPANPVIIEHQDYVFREAADKAASASAAPTAAPQPTEAPIVHERTPNEIMLFRYCAIQANPHRIHYDYPYATGVEGYRAPIVNGGLAALLLTETFRAEAGREPAVVSSRNNGLLYCNEVIRLKAQPGDPAWRLWAEDETGRRAVEATIE